MTSVRLPHSKCSPLSDGTEAVPTPKPLALEHRSDAKRSGKVKNRPEAHMGYPKGPGLLKEETLEGVSRAMSLWKVIWKVLRNEWMLYKRLFHVNPQCTYMYTNMGHFYMT